MSRIHLPEIEDLATAASRISVDGKLIAYRPDDPGNFGCLADARIWATAFFR